MEMLDPLILAEGFSRSLSTSDCQQKDHIKWTLILRHVGGSRGTSLHGSADRWRGSSGWSGDDAAAWHSVQRNVLRAPPDSVRCSASSSSNDDDGNAGGGVGPGAEKITPDQALDLEALLTEVKGNRAKFLQLMGVSNIHDLALSQHAQALRFLGAKRK